MLGFKINTIVIPFLLVYQEKGLGTRDWGYLAVSIRGSPLVKCINMVYTLIWRKLMEATVRKWGNSLGVRIPNLLVRELSLKDGSLVDINDRGKEIIIKPVKKNRLSEMLSNINENNIHKEIETGGPVGKEIW
jgi:antitoxin MazE